MTGETPSDSRALHDEDRSGTVMSKEGADDFKLGTRGLLVFLALSVLSLMAALDGTSVSVALPIMSEDLHGTAIESFWTGTSFLLTSTVFEPSFANLSNVFGRRPVILFSILLFFVGALVSGIAKNFTYMLVGRSIQGVGGGGIIALTEVIVTDVVPLRQRGQYLGILSAMWSIGSVTGPILGGGFAEDVTWRWVFYINFPFIGVGVVFVAMFLNLSPIPGSVVEKLRSIDWLGAVIFIGSMTSFLIPLTWGGVLYAWDSWRTLVPIIVGPCGLVAFAFYEYYVAEYPMIPPSIFNNRTATVTYIGSVVQGLVLWCVLYYLPLYFEAVKQYSPIIAGVALFPQTFTVAPSAIIVGFAITKTSSYRWAVWSGWVLSTLGMGLMCYIKSDSSIPQWLFINLVSGLGLGVLFPALTFAVQAATPSENLSMAVAMFSFFRALGQCIGVAVGGVVFQNQMKKNLLKYPSLAPMADTYSQDAAGLVRAIAGMADESEKNNLKDAYTDSLRVVYAVCCAICGIALFTSLLTKSYDLDQVLNSAQGLQTERTAADEEESKEKGK
ncbi:major facilitator superfamily domain-containing protein [Aspergillus caelatus]|uniref:Major facilitator superfamily domain-containing protein n=1 Tax=Aspergillus caelatus TaxID=61420 RepID=A0A5N6ZWW6_9EURO|nr:major facilitator superfamily domain-containing protein [Aspergillus caelatus]KAE8362114.1 major facilitator superfamily domain-containing protein [Aspergillus caelatus]